MARPAATDVAQNRDGSIMLKSYTIPFRPEYILVTKPDATDPKDMVSIAQPTNRNVPAFRFHLSPEAIQLIMAQDPNVRPEYGYCSLVIRFDAFESGPATIVATRGVRKSELARASAE